MYSRKTNTIWSQKRCRSQKDPEWKKEKGQRAANHICRMTPLFGYPNIRSHSSLINKHRLSLIPSIRIFCNFNHTFGSPLLPSLTFVCVFKDWRITHHYFIPKSIREAVSNRRLSGTTYAEMPLFWTLLWKTVQNVYPTVVTYACQRIRNLLRLLI